MTTGRVLLLRERADGVFCVCLPVAPCSRGCAGAASVAGTSAGRLYTRTCAHHSLDAVHVALNLTWWCRYCSWTGRQRHRRRAARCSSTVSPMLPPSVEPALCLSGKGGCRPLVKCLAYVVRSRCCPCQAVYARTSASQDPAKALCSTRRRSRLAGLVCAAWWRSPLPALPPPPSPPLSPRSELHLLSARQQPHDVLHCGDAWWA